MDFASGSICVGGSLLAAITFFAGASALGVDVDDWLVGDIGRWFSVVGFKIEGVIDENIFEVAVVSVKTFVREDFVTSG